MSEFKVNFGEPKTGKTHKKEISGAEADSFLNKKIGDKIKGDSVGFPGYEFEITGGSDSSGFPMRKDVNGNTRKKILIAGGLGTRHKRKGIRLRRTVAGNTIGPKTAQINLKVLKEGKKPLAEAPAKETKPEAEAPKAEDKKEEALKEEKPKEEVKEEKKEEPKEEKGKPSEDKKE